MKFFEGCLLACDIDGTLLSDGKIPQENIEKIKFFTENGGIFALATGRSVGAVSFVTDRIKCIGPSVVSNGGMIFDFATDSIIYEAKLNKDDYAVMYKIKEKFPDIGVEVHYGKNVGVYNKTSETDDHERYESLPSTLLEKQKTEKLAFNKILYALNKSEDAKILKDTIKDIKTSSIFLDTSAFLYGRKRYYLEQMPNGVSKSAGVKKLAEYLNIKKGNLFAIGDYYNDLEMLKIADVSAAPAESPKEIKDTVTCVTGSVENGAVADFIGYLTKQRRK